jgi:serine/threonine protein phosphatase PrpC
MNAMTQDWPAPHAAISAARSHVGRVRMVNEDRVLDRADRGLWAVADGMGGHSAGDVAAETAIHALRRLADEGSSLSVTSVHEALVEANRDIHALGRCARNVQGTTIVTLLIHDGAAQLLWAGDSRAYRVRGSHAEQLTRDHSVVQELVSAGVIDAEGARRHPSANMVTRALGAAETIVIDTLAVPLEAGDRLLLCSDGLSGSVDEADLLRVAELPLEEAIDVLLRAALTRDGSDNISIVGVEIAG